MDHTGFCATSNFKVKIAGLPPFCSVSSCAYGTWSQLLGFMIQACPDKSARDSQHRPHNGMLRKYWLRFPAA